MGHGEYFNYGIVIPDDGDPYIEFRAFGDGDEFEHGHISPNGLEKFIERNEIRSKQGFIRSPEYE